MRRNNITERAKRDLTVLKGGEPAAKYSAVGDLSRFLSPGAEEEGFRSVTGVPGGNVHRRRDVP
eukprot:13806153-Heterocapsa_arctica.AAC.1